MNRKRTFWASLGVAVVVMVSASFDSLHLVAQERVVRLNTHVNTLRTIPKEYGRVVGAITSELGQHSVVLEALDGRIWIVPFESDRPLYTFPRE